MNLMETESSQSPIGRPRCEAAKQAIFDAVWRLRSRMPLAAMSIEAIAREAGVGKATIYRWWPSKAAVALDAFLHRYVPPIGLPPKGKAIEQLQRQIGAVAKVYSGELSRMAADLIAQGQSDPEVLKLFNERFVQPRRAQAKRVIEAGIESGEIDPNIDPDMALDILFGPIYLRLLLRHVPIDPTFVKHLPKTVLRVLRADSAARVDGPGESRLRRPSLRAPRTPDSRRKSRSIASFD
jgi:AcrR family transcriptional regulator